MRVLGVITVLAAIFLATILTLDHIMTKSDQEQHERDAKWLAFSMEHHCRVVHSPGFWESTTTWQCDGGFQVVRTPRD